MPIYLAEYHYIFQGVDFLIQPREILRRSATIAALQCLLKAAAGGRLHTHTTHTWPAPPQELEETVEPRQEKITVGDTVDKHGGLIWMWIGTLSVLPKSTNTFSFSLFFFFIFLFSFVFFSTFILPFFLFFFSSPAMIWFCLRKEMEMQSVTSIWINEERGREVGETFLQGFRILSFFII